MRCQIPLFKFFLIIAAFAAAFVALSDSGRMGIIIATFLGTASGILIVAIRNKEDLLSCLMTLIDSVIGVFATLALMPTLHSSGHPSISENSEFFEYLIMLIILSTGAILGALVLSSVHRMDAYITDDGPKNDALERPPTDSHIHPMEDGQTPADDDTRVVLRSGDTP